MQVAMALQRRVKEEHDTLIKQEVLRQKETPRQKLSSLGTEKIQKYEDRFLEREYWKLVKQVVEGTLPARSETEAAGEKNIGEPQIDSAGVTAVVSDSTASAMLRPIDIQSLVLVKSVGLAVEPVNMVNVVQQCTAPRLTVNGGALEFGSARAAISGELTGVLWSYECYLACDDISYRGGKGKEKWQLS